MCLCRTYYLNSSSGAFIFQIYPHHISANRYVMSSLRHANNIHHVQGVQNWRASLSNERFRKLEACPGNWKLVIYDGYRGFLLSTWNIMCLVHTHTRTNLVYYTSKLYFKQPWITGRVKTYKSTALSLEIKKYGHTRKSTQRCSGNTSMPKKQTNDQNIHQNVQSLFLLL